MDRDPTPGDPDEVRELADELREFADNVAEALGKIRGLASERAVLDWAGLSADAFRSEFEGVPDNLTKLEDSYSLCARALHTYWPKLQTAQGMADRALDRAISAQADLASAQSALGDARDWVGRAGDEAERLQREGERENVEPPDEADVRAAARDQQAAEAAAGAARSRVNDAEERLAAARQLAQDAQEMREEAARECARDIDEASDAGIQNRRWWEKAIKWVTDNWDTLVDICKVIVAVLGVVVMIIGGPLAWVVLAAALVVLADTLVKYARGEAGLLDVAFAALDCIPGMKGLTTLGGLARGMRSLASTGLRGLGRGALGLGRNLRQRGVQMFRRNACGDPVDVATGELLMSATDVELPGVLPLVIERHHISTYRDGGWFGASWASTLDQRLVLDEYGVRLFTADGMSLLYPRPIPGESVLPVEGPRWTLDWDGQSSSPMAVHQRENGRTLHFAPIQGRPGSVLPLSAISDRNNNRITIAYDEHGAPTDVVHTGGYHLGVTTREGRITDLRLLNDAGQPRLLRYDYDEAGLLARLTNSSGQPLRFFYEGHRLARWEDRNGYWYAYEYDADGRCVFTTGTDRALEYRYTYDSANHRTTATNSLGHHTTYEFNDSYQLIAETDPLGHVNKRTYDRYDRVLSLTDPLGRTTRYEYADIGDEVAVLRPDGHLVRVEYNEIGLVTSFIEPDGARWEQGFDAAGNRTVLVDPAGNRTRYTYDARGGLATITDAAGATTLVRCDPAGLPMAITNPLGEVTMFRRDAFGRITATTDPLGNTTRTCYSPEGWLLSRIDPLGGTEIRTWDGEGNLLTLQDANGGLTRYEYGAFDQLTAQTGPDGARYEFLRDTELKLVRVTGPHGRTWDYTYDDAGRLISESDFDDRTVSYTLDAAGQLVARSNALGQTVGYVRNAVGDIIAKHTGDHDTSYVYDPVGRLLRAVGPDCELVIERDRLGQVLTETVNGRTLAQTYDCVGQPVRRITPSGHTSAWAYDESGRPVSLDSAGHTVLFEYDGAGREARRELDHGVALTHAWDPANRLARQEVVAPSRAAWTRSFVYRADAYLIGLEDSDRGRSVFGLDAIGRVTEVSAPGWSETYAYDAAGNQVSADWPAPAGNASGAGGRHYEGSDLRVSGRIRYAYDAAGRTVLRQRVRLSKKPASWRYEWDAEDRLTAVTTPDGARWEYRYDPLGRRVAKESRAADGTPGQFVEFTWVETTLVEQTTRAADGRSRTVTWDYLGLHPLTQVEQVSQSEIDRRFYAIVTDLVGAPTHLVDEDGGIAWEARTTVWGASAGGDDGAGTPLRFPGQYHDAETGWHYNLHRHYDPVTARYASPDPLGLDPAPNHYTYVHNPHTWTDPLGLAAHPTGLKNASAGLKNIFSNGSVRSRPIIEIRAALLDDGFVRQLAKNKKGYLYTNPAGEQVRIMRRNGNWDIRIQNSAGNNLDEFGNVAPPAQTHGINVYSR
ncbi:hypothetical protein EBN88_08615 [Streptomyces triticirhizae]|uniref:Rhs protein n=2 Tax=Streptomyces triticirhizae TaxID=2483353 RepID=A0A3M2M120_9ACTN|nr:hypothetical protein EBN88_08615 [Streptomyces triticirhizae]